MALYSVSIDAIALVGAAAKSIFELATPSTDDAQILEWWVDFDGVTSTAVPVKVEVGRFTAAVTAATTITPSKYSNTAAGASAVVAKHTTTTEGAGTATDVIIHRVSPTSGYQYVAPMGNEFFVAPSGFFRIRCTAAANVNVTFGCVWRD